MLYPPELRARARHLKYLLPYASLAQPMDLATPGSMTTIRSTGTIFALGRLPPAFEKSRRA